MSDQLKKSDLIGLSRFMYAHPDSKVQGNKITHTHKFEEFLLEHCIDRIFMKTQP